MDHKCGITPEMITELKDNEVFVFGSNLLGAHDGGAAYVALKWGAIRGEKEGIQGKTYALPTVDENIYPLSEFDLMEGVDALYKTIKSMPNRHFLITKVGCGIAGLKVEQIAFMFSDYLDIYNCSLPIEFIQHISSLNKN